MFQRSPSPSRIRTARRQRRQRITAGRSVRDSLISLAGILHSPVLNQSGEIGRLADVVARWDGQEAYPAVTGFVVDIGRRQAFMPIEAVSQISHSSVELRWAQVDRDFTRREGEVLLARDVLDHQLVDIDDVQVIRAADLYLATVPGVEGPAGPGGQQHGPAGPGGQQHGPAGPGGQQQGPVLRLVGVDVSAQTLLRRLGPKRWRGLPTPDRVIDWGAIQPFGSEVRDVRLRASNNGLHRLRPGELADLLEDLGRDARQELLASLNPEHAADALEEMDPEELGALLRETPPEDAAALLARMEPDEAVDALRDLEEEDREELFEHMGTEQRDELENLLHYEEDTAGGFMTTNLVISEPGESVTATRQRLVESREHAADIDAVAVVAGGQFLGDVSLFDLAVGRDEATLGELLADREPVMVAVNANLSQVAERLIESRHSSVVVVDDNGYPLGRILADDVVDALMPERGRLHFPRLLS